MKSAHPWVDGFPGAITVCGMDGIILEMNAKAKESFAKYGGGALVGRSLMDCHPQAARERIKGMLKTGESNIYTIEKKGVRKLIYQAPWFLDGKRAGLVELSLEIPKEMRHFNRD